MSFSLPFAHPWQWKSSSPATQKKAPPLSPATSPEISRFSRPPKLNSFFRLLSSSEKYLFFSSKNIFLRKIYVLHFLCPPHDLCCSHLFLPHSFCSPLFFSLICAPWRPTGPPSRKLLHVSESYCSFKKRG